VDVQVAGLIDLELDTALASLANRTREVIRLDNGAGLRVGHEAARTEDSAQATDLAHDLRGRDRHVELEPPALNLGDDVIEAHIVRAGLFRQACAVAFRKNQDAHGLAQPCGQQDGAAHLLIGMARVDAQTEMHLDGAVELRIADLLEECNGLVWRIVLHAVDELGSILVLLTVLCHDFLLYPA